jgi:hypothetical protein
MTRSTITAVVALLLVAVPGSTAMAQSPDPEPGATGSPAAETSTEPECRPSSAALAAEEVAGWTTSLQQQLDELRAEDFALASDIESQRLALEALGRIGRTFSWTLSSSTTPAAQAALVEKVKARALREGDAADALSEAFDPSSAELPALDLPATFSALDEAYEALVAVDPCVGTKLHSLADLRKARGQKVSKDKVLSHLKRMSEWEMRDGAPRAYDPPYADWPFQSACADRTKGLPKASVALDQQVGCLWALATMWDAYQHLDLTRGDPEQAFDAIEATYAWVASRVGKQGMRYIDRGLKRLDAARKKPPKPKKAKTSLNAMLRSPVPGSNPAAMHRLLHEVYADTLPLLLPTKSRGFASTVPFTYFYRRNGNVALPGACEMPRDLYPPGCARPVANAFLAYQRTGDPRWYQLANGMRGHILAGNRREYQPYFNERVRCYLKKNPQQC